MKKVITIGRGDEADIRIDDDTVSRRHATIRFLPLGKMEIRDLSTNGTFVNGIRLALNKPYPVTRKDVVSFARTSQLDWKDVPNPMKPYKIIAWIVIGIIVALIAWALVSKIEWSSNDPRVPDPPHEDVTPDEKPNGSVGEGSGDDLTTPPNPFKKPEENSGDNEGSDKGQNGKGKEGKKTNQQENKEENVTTPENKPADQTTPKEEEKQDSLWLVG